MLSGAAVLILLGLNLATETEAGIFWKSDETGVYVIDGAFNKVPKALRDAIATFKDSSWKFTVDETLSAEGNQSYKLGFRTKYTDTIRTLKVNKILAKIVSETYSIPNVYVTEAQGRMIERGDFSPVVKQCFQGSSKFIALVTLSKKWRKNYYGEITVYGSDGEVLKSIYPRFGRVVLIPCGIPFKVSPPCVNAERRHYILFLEFGEQQSKHVKNSEDPDLVEIGLTDYFAGHHNKSNISNREIDPEKIVTRKFYTKDGKKVFVYDGAFHESTVDILHEYIANYADYYESPVFDKDTADNVKWIISLDDPYFVDGPIWNTCKQLLMHIAGKEFFPYDLACNHVRRTDNTFVHKDNYEDSDEYTVLIYLNKNWTENDYGETTFLQNDEIVAALRPRYGRVVIFHGTIDHSAHPAGPEHQGARYTFAIKTASSHEHALNRVLLSEADVTLSEAMERLNNLKAKGTPAQQKSAQELIDVLKTGRLMDNDFIPKLNKVIKS